MFAIPKNYLKFSDLKPPLMIFRILLVYFLFWQFWNFFFRLTDTSDEDRARQPMTEAEMLQMPKYVAENRRCACPEDDCNYVTVDTFMLVSFLIKANSFQEACIKCLTFSHQGRVGEWVYPYLILFSFFPFQKLICQYFMGIHILKQEL